MAEKLEIRHRAENRVVSGFIIYFNRCFIQVSDRQTVIVLVRGNSLDISDFVTFVGGESHLFVLAT